MIVRRTMIGITAALQSRTKRAKAADDFDARESTRADLPRWARAGSRRCAS